MTRFDVPLDASPVYQAFCERVKQAIERHGTHNTYYLHHSHCRYRLLNGTDDGLIEFSFEGVAFTDSSDMQCKTCELDVELVRETCDWLSQPIVDWFQETVPRSVAAEFDRYIKAGDLSRTKERIEKIQQASDDAGGYLGMYL